MSTSSPSKPTVLVLSYSDLATDPRVHRQLQWLQADYRLVALGTGAPQWPEVDFHPVAVRSKTEVLPKLVSAFYRLTGQYTRYYWHHDYISQPAEALSHLQPDLVIANDIETLPLALHLAKGRPVIFDAHEYAPLEFENLLAWRLWTGPVYDRLCRHYLPQVHTMLTVCQGIADKYAARYGVRAQVLTSAPSAVPLSPRPTDGSRIRLIHHGAALASRKIENMIQMMAWLDDRFSLDLMLVANQPDYIAQLQALAKPYPNVRFLPPVPMPEIAAFIAQYDIGLFLLEPTNFNYLMALPNKFFEYLQARLAIAIGPSPEMARLVREHDCGVVAADFSPRSLADMLNALTPERIDHFKAQSHKLAAVHNAEANGDTFRQLVAAALD